jgi:hypothetical protein
MELNNPIPHRIEEQKRRMKVGLSHNHSPESADYVESIPRERKGGQTPLLPYTEKTEKENQGDSTR